MARSVEKTNIIYRNRWMNLMREIRLDELMKLIPDDEFVIIFDDLAGANGFREEDALFDGQVMDWWEEKAARLAMDAHKRRVLGFQVRELETVAGPVIMIVTEF